MALEPRIETIRKEYGLEASDFWQIPQNKQWVCKHSALEIVAVKANIKFDLPVIIEKDAPTLVTSLIVMGHMADRSEWATGETNPTNYSVCGKQPSYPWAMSEKRAKDRVILKLVGIHGLVYSQSEIGEGNDPVADEQPPAAKPISSAQQKKGLEAIEGDLLDCHSIGDVNKCAKIWATIMDRDGWARDFRDIAIPKFQKRREIINQETEAADVFPGDLPSNANGYVNNVRAG